MSTKQMKFDVAARHDFSQGVAQIARAVAVTMGPTGRHVVVQKSYGGPTVTKDGVNVAKEIELPQPFENMGAKMVHQVAKKVHDEAGELIGMEEEGVSVGFAGPDARLGRGAGGGRERAGSGGRLRFPAGEDAQDAEDLKDLRCAAHTPRSGAGWNRSPRAGRGSRRVPEGLWKESR